MSSFKSVTETPRAKSPKYIPSLIISYIVLIEFPIFAMTDTPGVLELNPVVGRRRVLEPVI